MPISFESPAPFNATLAARYGQYQGGQAATAQANAANAQAQGDAADRQLRATLAGEQLAGSMSQANADRAAMMENAGRERAHRFVEAEQGNQQRQEQMKLQSQLQTTELTQTEQLRYNRMKQAVGSVNADDTLAPEEKHALITQLQTGINPLEQRLAATKVQQEELQTKQLVAHAQKLAALDAATGATRAKLIEQQLYKIPNPNSPTGEDAFTIDPKTGQLHPVKLTEPAKAAAAVKPEKIEYYKRTPTAKLTEEAIARAAQKGTSVDDEFNALNAIEDAREMTHTLAHGRDNMGRPINPPAGASATSPATAAAGSPIPAAGQAPPPQPVDIWDFSKMSPQQKQVRQPFAERMEALGKQGLPKQEEMRRQLVLQKMTELAMQYPFNAPPDAISRMAALEKDYNRAIPSQPSPSSPPETPGIGLSGTS